MRRSGRPRRLLGPTVGAAVLLAFSALVLWAVALWAAWAGECPASAQSNDGISRSVSVWPPSAQCTDHAGGTFWHQALPWAPWLIGTLIVAAAAILLTGLVATIRDLRRPAPAASPESVSLLEAPLPGGPAGGHPATRRDVEGDERDAMAA